MIHKNVQYMYVFIIMYLYIEITNHSLLPIGKQEDKRILESLYTYISRIEN